MARTSQIIYPGLDISTSGWRKTGGGVDTTSIYANIDEGTAAYSDIDYIYSSGASFPSPSSAIQYVAFSGGTGNFSPTAITTYPHDITLRLRAQRRRDKDGGDTPAAVKWYVTDNAGNRLDRPEHTWDMFYPLNSSVGTYGDYAFTKRAIMPSGADLYGSQIHIWTSGYTLHQNVSGVVISALEVYISGTTLDNVWAAPIADNLESSLNASGSPYSIPNHITSGLFRNVDDFYQKDLHDTVGGGGSYSVADNDWIEQGGSFSMSAYFNLGASQSLPVSGDVYVAIQNLSNHNISVLPLIGDAHGYPILTDADQIPTTVPGPIGSIHYMVLPVTNEVAIANGYQQLGYDLSNLLMQVVVYSGVGADFGSLYPQQYKIYALECNLSGILYSNNSLPLYISGHMATGITNTLPLYVSGSTGYSSGYLDLYINGGFSNSLDLFVQGATLLSGSLPLYTSGHLPDASLPLYLHGPVVSSGTNTIPFVSFGSAPGTSGIFEQTTFYIKGTGAEGAMPLYLAGAATANESAVLPLFAYGAGFNVASGIDLFIQNNYIDSGIPLYIRGRGINVNPDPLASGDGVILDAAIPLFINRVNEVEVLPLYLHNNQVDEDLPFYVFGAYSTNSGINLSIPNVAASSIKHLPLYVHGF